MYISVHRFILIGCKYNRLPCFVCTKNTEHFLAHNRALIRQYKALPEDQLGYSRLTSPASEVIVLRLEDVVRLLPMHEQRHLQQAIRVMESEEFPER
jgi:hypothetical protein